MALTATQRDFILYQLGVGAGTGSDTATDVGDFMLSAALEGFLREEEALLSQLAEARKVSGAGANVDTIERMALEAQKKVEAAKREGGTDIIDDAASTLKELTKSASSIVANKDFYVELDKVEKALAALDNHLQRQHIADERKTAKDNLDAARKLAGQGKYTDAGNALTTAKKACDDGKKYADEFTKFVPVKANAMRVVGAMKGVYSDNAVWEGFFNDAVAAAAKADPPDRKYTEAANELKDIIKDQKDLMVDVWVNEDPEGFQELKDAHANLPAESRKAIGIDADMDAIRNLRAQIADDINKENWGRVVLVAQAQLGDQVTAAAKLAVRRVAYDDQRKQTKTDLDALDAHKASLRLQIAALGKLLEKADAKATRSAMLFEDGINGLKEISKTAKELLKVASDAEAYVKARQQAEEKLKALRDTPAAKAGVLDERLVYVDGIMLQAQQATGLVDVNKAASSGIDFEDGRAHQLDWGAACKSVALAVTAIADATKMASDLESTVDAATVAAGADTVDKVELAAAELREQAKVAQKEKFADKAEHEFTHIFASLDEALDQAKNGRLEIAAIPLNGAARLLIEARQVQLENARFETAFKDVDDRLKVLTALTDPPAAKLKRKTDPIAEQLSKATEENEARAWDKSNALLAAAAAAVTEAESMADARRAFDAEALRLTNAAASLATALKDSVTKVIDQAKAKADDFNFTHAMRLLANADAQVLSTKVMEKARLAQIDKEFYAAVDKMLSATGGDELVVRAGNPATGPGTTGTPATGPTVKDGEIPAPPSGSGPSGPKDSFAKRDSTMPNGQELLDELVQKLPNTVPVKVIAALAQKRFGIDLKISALYYDGGELKEQVPANPNFQEPKRLRQFSQRTKSAKKIYEMLALTPEQTKDNPSLKQVVREDALKNIQYNAITGGNNFDFSNGGYYRGSDSFTSMSGRPGDVKQSFGSKQRGAQRDADNNVVYDGSGDAVMVKELPPAESPVYEPANEDDVDYFDFANVHETGHSVDDRMGFMASRLGQAAFGNWQQHGGDLTPIITQVLARFGNGKDHLLKQWVNDLIVGANPPPPAVDPADEVAVNTACKDIQQWHKVATAETLWWDDGNSRRYTMPDGRVYQEAYAKTWVSYPYAERAKGITGYQFRAPGEWFAELYAAYHLDKLKPGHPARKWLSELAL